MQIGNYKYAVKGLLKLMDKNKLANVYSINTVRQKLKDRYKEHVYFVSDLGGSDIVFQRYGKTLSLEITKSHKTKESIIEAAAKIIRWDIRSIKESKSCYLSVRDIEESENWIPELLQILSGYIISSHLKKRSIG